MSHDDTQDRSLNDITKAIELRQKVRDAEAKIQDVRRRLAVHQFIASKQVLLEAEENEEIQKQRVLDKRRQEQIERLAWCGKQQQEINERLGPIEAELEGMKHIEQEQKMERARERDKERQAFNGRMAPLEAELERMKKCTELDKRLKVSIAKRIDVEKQLAVMSRIELEKELAVRSESSDAERIELEKELAVMSKSSTWRTKLSDAVAATDKPSRSKRTWKPGSKDGWASHNHNPTDLEHARSLPQTKWQPQDDTLWSANTSASGNIHPTVVRELADAVCRCMGVPDNDRS